MRVNSNQLLFPFVLTTLLLSRATHLADTVSFAKHIVINFKEIQQQGSRISLPLFNSQLDEKHA